MSHGMRRRLMTSDGLYKPTSPVTLLTGASGAPNPDPPPDTPPPGAQAEFTGGPWYTKINWTTAVIGGAGRTTSQWFGSLGYCYVNSDHTSDAPVNTWHTRNSDPVWTITGMFNGNVNVGGTARINIPAGLYVPFASGDQNLNVWNHDTGFHYDFYGVSAINQGAHTMQAQAIWQLHESADGWGTGVFPNGKPRGTRACGCQFGPGSITAGDWRAGFINHALGFAAGASNWSKTPSLPAVKNDSYWQTGYTGNVPLGTLFGIPPGTPKPGGMTTIGSMAWDAISTWGAYAVDSTGSFAFYADDGNDPIQTSWVTGLNGADGTRIVGAMRMLTKAKNLPNHV